MTVVYKIQTLRLLLTVRRTVIKLEPFTHNEGVTQIRP